MININIKIWLLLYSLMQKINDGSKNNNINSTYWLLLYSLTLKLIMIVCFPMSELVAAAVRHRR